MIPFDIEKYKAGVPVVRRDGGTPPIAVVPTPDCLNVDGKLRVVYANGLTYPHAVDGAYIPGTEHAQDIGHPDPEPVERPWSKPEDVPGPVCWLSNSIGHIALVVAIHEKGPVAAHPKMHQPIVFLWENLTDWQHSTDRKTWHPCTVKEESK